MSTIKIMSLAIGASIIGSIPALIVITPGIGVIAGIFFVGLVFLSHGTGIMELSIRKLLICYRGKKPAVGVISDLPWASKKDTRAWAWSKMAPAEWSKILSDSASP